MRSERWAFAAVAIAGVGLPVIGGLLSLLTSDVLYLVVGLTCAVPALVGGGVAMVASRQSRTEKAAPPAPADPKRTRAPRTTVAGDMPSAAPSARAPSGEATDRTDSTGPVEPAASTEPAVSTASTAPAGPDSDATDSADRLGADAGSSVTGSSAT